jgi:transposase
MYYIGIDVAKHHHDAIGLDEAGQVVIPPFRFANTQRGVNELLDRLHRLDGSIRIALESTGHYWLALYEHLLKHGLSVAVLNPIQVKAYRQVGIRKTKTDPLDSFWIADFLRIGRAQPMAVPSPNIRQMRELARFRFTLLDRRADIQRRALAILDRVFPEYHTLFSRPFGPTSRHLLRRAVTAHEFAAWPLQGLTEAIRKASRGRLGHSLARRIHTAAQHSLGICSLEKAARVEMTLLLDRWELLTRQMATLDEHLATLLAQEEQYLDTIPGISTTLAATILGEIGDIQRFPSLKQLVAYAGLDPTIHQSGQFRATQARLSKRGSPYLRRAVWMAATMARQYNPDLAAFYQRKRRQGKHHNVAMAAVCHRLLARIYVVLKEQRPYEVRGPNPDPPRLNEQTD